MPPKPVSRFAQAYPTSLVGKGHGDLAMKSSDNVVLYFPKVLLILASPVFRDMFGMTEHATDSSSVDNAQPLAMEEDSETLEELLLSIDPSKVMPPINPSTIEKVFRAAHKYQIEKFITYFSYVVGQGPTCACAVHCGEFLSTNATLVLSLAERYDFPDLARLALRQLIVEPMDTLLASSPAISVKMWPHLLHLRKQRTEWLLEYIDRMVHSHHSPESHLVCVPCYACLITWTKKVHDTPSWSSVEKEFPTWPVNCASTMRDNYGRIQKTTPQLKLWGTEAGEMEWQLPALPQGLFGS